MKLKISSILQNQYATFSKLKAITIVLLFVFLSFSAFSIDKPTFRVIINPDSPNPTECTFRLNPGEDTGNYNNVQLWPIGTNESKWHASYSTTGGFFFNCYYVEFSSIDITSSKTYNSTDVPSPFNYIYHGNPVKIVASNIPGPPSITSPSTVTVPPSDNFIYKVEADSLFDVTYKSPIGYAFHILTPIGGTPSLPPGLSYDSSTHEITGTVTTGTYHLTVYAANAAGESSKDVTVYVGTAPSITSATTIYRAPGESLNYEIKASGSPTITYNADTFNPSNVLTYDGSNHITGFNLATGICTFNVYADNFLPSDPDTKTVTLKVGVAPTMSITSPITINQGEKLSYDINGGGDPVPTYTFSEISPSGTQLQVVNGKVEINGELPYEDINDKTITFKITASNHMGSVSKNVTVNYKGEIGISLYNATANGVNPQGFSISTGNKGVANFSISNPDILKVYTDEYCTTEFNFSSVTMPEANLPPTLYLKALAPITGATATINRSDIFNLTENVNFSVTMANPNITGSIAGGTAVAEADEDDPVNLVSYGSVIELAMNKGGAEIGNIKLEIAGFPGPAYYGVYYDRECTQPAGSSPFSGAITTNPTGIVERLCGGSLFIKPFGLTENASATLTYTNSSGYTASDKVNFKVDMIGVNITGYSGADEVPEKPKAKPEKAADLGEDNSRCLTVPAYDKASVDAGTVPGYVKVVLNKGDVSSGKINFSIKPENAVIVYTDQSLTKTLSARSVDIGTPTGDLAPLAGGSMTLYLKPIKEGEVTAKIAYGDGSTNIDKFCFTICSECPCTGCPPGKEGDDSIRDGNINSKFSMGSNSYGKPAGSIYLNSAELSMGMAGPGALQIVPFQGTTVNYTYDPNDSTIVQKIDINTGVTEIEIAFTTATHGTKKYYTSNTMTYRKAGETTPYRTVTISNMYAPVPLGGDDYDFTVSSLNISNALTLSSGTVTTTAKYEKPDANTWKLTRNNSIVEYLNTVTDSSAGTKTETYYIGSMTTPVFKDTNIYKIYPWGDALIQNIGAETTTYEYYDNAGTDGMKLGNLKKVTYPKGDTVEYTYGANGNLLETITTKGGHVYKTTREVFSIARIDVNSIPGTPSICGIDATTGTFDYGTLQPTDTLTLLGTREINKQYCDNVLTSHSESINYYDYSAGVDEYNVYDEANIAHMTTTEYYSDKTDTVRYGRVKKVVNSDGNIALYEYSQSGGLETVTSYSGEPDAGGNTVVNGTKNVSVYNQNGTLMSSTSYAIVASALTQTASQTTAAADLDEFGRATKTTYMDGTTVERTYGCCGVDSETDRNGITTTYQYDATSKLMTSSTRNGISTLYTYDQAGNTLTTTVKGRAGEGGSGGTELTSTNVYNEYGVMTSSTDPMNYTTTYTNNGDTVTYPNGTTSVTNYTGGVVSGTSGTAVHAVTYTSGPDWQKVMPQDITTYTDLLGRQYKTVYADSTFTETFYNSKGQAVKTVSPAGKITLTEYDSIGRVYRSAVDMNLDSTIDSGDIITEYAYSYSTRDNKTVFVTTVTRKQGTDSQVLSVAETSVDGHHSWASAYGRTSYSKTEILGSGQVKLTRQLFVGTTPKRKTVTHYLNGQITLVEKFNDDGTAGNTFEYAYDEFDRVSSITEKCNSQTVNLTTYTYDANGRQLSLVVNGRTTSYEYDNVGRRTKTTLPGNRVVNYEYHSTGELRKQYGDDTYTQEYTYNDFSNMATLKTFRTAGVADTTTWGYNNRQFMTSKTYADGKATTYTYTDDGELHVRTWARLVDGNALTTTYSYDNAGRKTGIDYSDSTPDLTFSYDYLGRVTSVSDGAGTRAFTYNSDSTLANIGVPHILNGMIEYSYDNMGRRTSMTLKEGSTVKSNTAYTYDVKGRIASVGDGVNTATYAYKTGLNILDTTTIADSSSTLLTTTRSYDSYYRLLSTSSVTGGSSPVTKAYSYIYNDKDQRTKLTLPDGSYWEYTYDDKGQVISGIKKNSSGNSIAGQNFAYEYDGIGNRKWAKPKLPEMKIDYTSNNINQYTAVNTPGIVPVLGEADADTTVQAVRTDASNLTGGKQKTIPARSGKYFSGAFTGIDNSSAAQTIPYDVYAIKDETTTQQIQKASSSYTVPKAVTSPTYDTDGNMLTDGTGWNYTWNGENRMIQAVKTDDTKIEFKYDFMGRRFEKKKYSWVSSAWQLDATEKYVWNNYNIIAIYNASTTLQKTMLYGLDINGGLQSAGGVGGLLLVNDVVNTKTYLPVYDGNGNVRVYLDSSDGSKVVEYDYSTGTDFTIKTGTKADELAAVGAFSTMPFDPDAKFIRWPFRIGKGRFLSRDPKNERGFRLLTGISLDTDYEPEYVLAQNDTINNWDYLGLKKGEVLWIIYNPTHTKRGIVQKSINHLAGLSSKIKTFFLPTPSLIPPTFGRLDPFDRYLYHLSYTHGLKDLCWDRVYISRFKMNSRGIKVIAANAFIDPLGDSGIGRWSASLDYDKIHSAWLAAQDGGYLAGYPGASMGNWLFVAAMHETMHGVGVGHLTENRNKKRLDRIYPNQVMRPLGSFNWGIGNYKISNKSKAAFLKGFGF